MASMRTLRRRLLRWQRYADRIGNQLGDRSRREYVGGFNRAARAVQAEEERRFWAETPEVWLGGPAGEAALLHDVLDDEQRRRADHVDACWQGCDDLHYCPDCGHHGCEGDCDEASADGPDDDAGHGDSWRPVGEPPDDWRLP